jgi:hypothetical protein
MTVVADLQLHSPPLRSPKRDIFKSFGNDLRHNNPTREIAAEPSRRARLFDHGGLRFVVLALITADHSHPGKTQAGASAAGSAWPDHTLVVSAALDATEIAIKHS